MPGLHDSGILAPGRTPGQRRAAGALFVLCGRAMLAIGCVFAAAGNIVTAPGGERVPRLHL